MISGLEGTRGALLSVKYGSQVRISTESPTSLSHEHTEYWRKGGNQKR